SFYGDAAAALVGEGVRFESARALPPPDFVNELFNGYLSAHLDELLSTGELPLREAIPAILLSLLSKGKLDKRVHPNTAILLACVQAGNLTIYRDVKRIDAQVAELRQRVREIWESGRLIVAPTSTISPPT